MAPELCQSCQIDGRSDCWFVWAVNSFYLPAIDRAATSLHSDDAPHKLAIMAKIIIEISRNEAKDKKCPNASYDPPYAGKQFEPNQSP